MYIHIGRREQQCTIWKLTSCLNCIGMDCWSEFQLSCFLCNTESTVIAVLREIIAHSSSGSVVCSQHLLCWLTLNGCSRTNNVINYMFRRPTVTCIGKLKHVSLWPKHFYGFTCSHKIIVQVLLDHSRPCVTTVTLIWMTAVLLCSLQRSVGRTSCT